MRHGHLRRSSSCCPPNGPCGENGDSGELDVALMRPLRLSIALMLVFAAAPAAAGERYALIVTGAAGGADYVKKYHIWRVSFVTTLKDKLGYPADHIQVLADEDEPGVAKATRENVR